MYVAERHGRHVGGPVNAPCRDAMVVEGRIELSFKVPV